MDLNLTTGKYENMSDTNKLLYLIYGEVQQIRQVLDRADMDSLLKELKQGNTNIQAEPQSPTTEQAEPAPPKEGRICKYCGEFIGGNHGDYLAHIRKCPERTKGSD